MRDVLVFYATTDGQTRRIAERISRDIGARGFNARAIDVTTAEAARIVWDNVRGVVLGASLHAGRHQHAAVEFATCYRDRLNLYPSAFFSVSLSAASANPEEVATAARLARELPAAVGWRGAYEGWMPTPDTFKHVSKQLPGLERFFMAGQWVEPGGGVPMAIMSGRHVAEILCAAFERPFNSTGGLRRAAVSNARAAGVP